MNVTKGWWGAGGQVNFKMKYKFQFFSRYNNWDVLEKYFALNAFHFASVNSFVFFFLYECLRTYDGSPSVFLTILLAILLN